MSITRNFKRRNEINSEKKSEFQMVTARCSYECHHLCHTSPLVTIIVNRGYVTIESPVTQCLERPAGSRRVRVQIASATRIFFELMSFLHSKLGTTLEHLCFRPKSIVILGRTKLNILTLFRYSTRTETFFKKP